MIIIMMEVVIMMMMAKTIIRKILYLKATKHAFHCLKDDENGRS